MPYVSIDAYIYSNDGTTELGLLMLASAYIAVTGTGCMGEGMTYEYQGDKIFLGLATSANATTPTYAIGDTFSFSDGAIFYIVESAVTDLTNTTWYVPSGWTASAGYGKFSIDHENGNQNTLYIGYSLKGEPGDFTYPATNNSIVSYGSVFPTYTSGTAFTLGITGGRDVTNPSLISWLETNGTQLKVTDLTNTTWHIPAGWEAEAGYGKFYIEYSFAIIGGIYDGTTDTHTNILIGTTNYPDGGDYANIVQLGGYLLQVPPYESFTITITGGTGTTNPKLIAWLSQYGELQEEETYTLSGVWKFNEEITVPQLSYPPSTEEQIETFQSIAFTSAGDIFSRMCVGTTNGKWWNWVLYDNFSVYLSSWTDGPDDLYRTVDFGATEQEVSQEFYEWFTENATQQAEEETPTEYVTITYGNKTITLTAGQKCTFKGGKVMQSDIVAKVVGESEGTEDELAGTWVFNDFIDILPFATFTLNFSCSNVDYTSMSLTNYDPGDTLFSNDGYLRYGDDYAFLYYDYHENLDVYEWVDDKYKIINITSKLADVNYGEALLTWLEASATKQGAEQVKLISFTIDGTKYQAESGMKWAEWCVSEYNTGGYYFNNLIGCVADSSGVNGITAAYADAVITATDYVTRNVAMP